MERELRGWRFNGVVGWPLVLATWWVLVLLPFTSIREIVAQPAAAPSSSAEALRIYEGAANAQNQKAYDLAAEEWAQFLKRYPRDPLAPKARYYQGVCHLQLRNWEAAIDSFSAVVRQSPGFELLEDALLNLGWSQFSAAEGGRREQFAPAIETFTQLLEKFPQGKRRDEALFFRAESYYALEKRREAVGSFRELTQKHGDSPLRCDALYALGVALEDLQEYADAGRAYDQLLADCESHELITEVRMRKAETLLQTDYVEAADQMFGEVAAITDFPAADHALTRQAVCRAKQEKFSEAGELYAQVAERFPQSSLVPDAEISAGRAYYRGEDFAAAKRWFVAAESRSESSALEAAHWLCRILLREGNPAGVERLVAKHRPQAAGSPLETDLLVDLADALYEQPDRRSEALALYLEVADLHPEHRQAPQSLYNAAFTALELRRLDQCVELSARFLAEHPEDPLGADATLLAVEAHLDKRDFAAAQRNLESLIARYSDRPERDNWRLRLGLIQYVAGQYVQAIEHLRATLPDLESGEQVAEAQYLIGASHFFQDQFPAARAALDASQKASSKWRQADEAMLLLARTHQKESQWQKALETLAKFLGQYPESSVRDQALYRQGEIHYVLADFEDAILSYGQVAKFENKSSFTPYALYGMGWSHLKQAEYPDASRSFTRLLESYPGHELTRSGRLAAGMSLRQEGKLAEAIAELQKYLATNPPQPQRSDALYERGLAEAARSNHAQAAASFVEILTAHAEYAHADKVRYELAWAYRNENDPDRAHTQFALLAKEFPESPLAAEANFHLGEDLYEKEKFAEALAPFRLARQGASLSELKEKATYKLGWTHFQLKQYSEAAEVFADQAASFPDGILTGDALFMKAESLFQQGEHEGALAAFQLASRSKPSSEQMEILSLMHAGQSASQLKDFRKAIEFFDQLESRFPRTTSIAEAWYERGWARQNLEELDQALLDYERAAEARDALGARARFMMGQVRFAQKNHGEAIREFQRAMFLYGGEDAPPEIKNWQAKAAYEAGRCAEVQIQNATSAELRATAISNAKKFYHFVVQNGADQQLAATAQKRLDVLVKL